MDPTETDTYAKILLIIWTLAQYFPMCMSFVVHNNPIRDIVITASPNELAPGMIIGITARIKSLGARSFLRPSSNDSRRLVARKSGCRKDYRMMEWEIIRNNYSTDQNSYLGYIFHRATGRYLCFNRREQPYLMPKDRLQFNQERCLISFPLRNPMTFASPYLRSYVGFCPNGVAYGNKWPFWRKRRCSPQLRTWNRFQLCPVTDALKACNRDWISRCTVRCRSLASRCFTSRISRSVDYYSSSGHLSSGLSSTSRSGSSISSNTLYSL